MHNYTVFPVSLIEETIRILRSRGCEFAVASDVGELARGSRSRLQYLKEYADWQSGAGWLGFPLWLLQRRLSRATRRAMQTAKAPRGRPQVFLHHDADRNPQNTIAVMRRERDLGAVSSAYFFVERAPRRPDDIEPYDVDIEALQQLEASGFEIGYHLNAPELAKYDKNREAEILDRDLAFFRRHFRLRSFVPHGGEPSPNGRNNESIAHPADARDLVWFYNGRGVITDVVWSDGHLESSESEALPDPRDVARRLEGRVRARFLFHPQYYGDTLREDLSGVGVTKTAWWKGLWNGRTAAC